MRSPLGTYLARPSGHDSFLSDSSGIHRAPNLAGIVAESICCQMLWCHSLASLEDAVRTIFGDPKESLPELVARQQVNNGADNSISNLRCQAQCLNSFARQGAGNGWITSY